MFDQLASIHKMMTGTTAGPSARLQGRPAGSTQEVSERRASPTCSCSRTGAPSTAPWWHQPWQNEEGPRRSGEAGILTGKKPKAGRGGGKFGVQVRIRWRWRGPGTLATERRRQEIEGLRSFIRDRVFDCRQNESSAPRFSPHRALMGQLSGASGAQWLRPSTFALRPTSGTRLDLAFHQRVAARVPRAPADGC